MDPQHASKSIVVGIVLVIRLRNGYGKDVAHTKVDGRPPGRAV